MIEENFVAVLRDDLEELFICSDVLWNAGPYAVELMDRIWQILENSRD
jgi:hypothetical protein